MPRIAVGAFVCNIQSSVLSASRALQPGSHLSTHSNQTSMRNIAITATLILLTGTLRIYGQLSLSGQITTPDHQPVSQVTVSIPSLNLSTITNDMGGYRFYRLPKAKVVLQISHVGFKTATIAVNLNKSVAYDYTLIPADVTLSEVLVSGNARVGYRTSGAQAGPLGNLSLTDIPFSINVTPEALIENRGVHTMADALQTNPTVAVLMSSNTYSSMSRMMVRGFSAADQSELRDGLTDRSFSYVPIENVDRIEVLNGLSGFLYGFSSIGGTVNYISKQPTKTRLNNFSIGRYGGGMNYFHADLGGQSDSSGRLGYRVNAYREDGSTYIKDGDQKRTLMSAVLHYKLLPGTVLKADIYHQALNMHGLQTYFAMPAAFTRVPDAFDPATQYGQPWTFNEAMKTLLGMSIESRVNRTFTFRGAYRYGEMWRNYSFISARLTDNAGSYEESFIASPRQEEDTHSSYALVDASFNTGRISHQLTFGYTGTVFFYKRGADVKVLLGNSNIDHPEYYDIPASTGPLTTFQGQTMNNFLVGDRVSLGQKWVVLLGLNQASIVQKAGGTNTGISTSNFRQQRLTPSAAITFKPELHTAVYLSYMQGLGSGGAAPITAVNASAILQPSASDQWEAGVKTTVGHVDVTAALFTINKINEYIDPADSVYKQDGREVHQGLEVTATGKLTNSLSIVGGFTIMKAKMTRTANAPSIKGKIPINVPQHQARLFVEYAIPSISNLFVSAGSSYLGKRPTDNLNLLFLPDAVIWDAGMRYEMSVLKCKTTLMMNASNIFNKHYWINFRTGDGLQLGTPRVCSFAIKFSI